jgi:hypothetical protein
MGSQTKSGKRLVPTRVSGGPPVRVVLINAEEIRLTIWRITNPLTAAVLRAAIGYFDHLTSTIFKPRETTAVSQLATSADVPPSATVRCIGPVGVTTILAAALRDVIHATYGSLRTAMVTATTLTLRTAIVTATYGSWRAASTATTSAPRWITLSVTANLLGPAAPARSAGHPAEVLISFSFAAACLAGLVAAQNRIVAAGLLKRATDADIKTFFRWRTTNIIPTILIERAASLAVGSLIALATEAPMRRATLSVLAEHIALAAVRSARCTALLISADLSSGAAVLVTGPAGLRRRATTFSRARLSRRAVTWHHALVTIVIDAEMLTLSPNQLAGVAVFHATIDVDAFFEAVVEVTVLRIGSAPLSANSRASRCTRYRSRSLEDERAFQQNGIIVGFTFDNHGAVVSLSRVKCRLSGKSRQLHSVAFLKLWMRGRTLPTQLRRWVVASL